MTYKPSHHHAPDPRSLGDEADRAAIQRDIEETMQAMWLLFWFQIFLIVVVLISILAEG